MYRVFSLLCSGEPAPIASFSELFSFTLPNFFFPPSREPVRGLSCFFNRSVYLVGYSLCFSHISFSLSVFSTSGYLYVFRLNLSWIKSCQQGHLRSEHTSPYTAWRYGKICCLLRRAQKAIHASDPHVILALG